MKSQVITEFRNLPFTRRHPKIYNSQVFRTQELTGKKRCTN